MSEGHICFSMEVPVMSTISLKRLIKGLSDSVFREYIHPLQALFSVSVLCLKCSDYLLKSLSKKQKFPSAGNDVVFAFMLQW